MQRIINSTLKNGSKLLLRKQTNILSAAFVIMAIYGVSYLVGLVKTRLLISYFFESSASLLDVYYAAFVVPDTLFQLLVVGAMSAAFIPTFSKYLEADEKEAWKIASSTLNLIVLSLLVICAVVFILAKPISQAVAPGFNGQQISTMVHLMRIMLVAQVFFSVSGFLTSLLQTHHRFLVPALAPVAYNLGIILGVVILSPRFGILGPAFGVVLGAVLHMVIQLPVAFKLGFKYTPRVDTKHPGLREIIRLMPPRALALGMDQIEQFVAVTLASILTSGSLSMLNAARMLYSIPASLFGMTIGQAAFPALSKEAGNHDLSEFKKILADSLLQIIFIALPVSVLFIILRIPIVRILFGSRTFPWLATLLTGKTLAILSVSASFYAVMQLITRGYYALHDTSTPLKVGIAAAIFDIAFSVVAVYVLEWGLLGIALGISLTAILETIALAVLLYKQIGSLSDLKYLSVSLLKMLVIGLATGISLWLPMRFLDQFVFDTTRTLPLLALTAITSIIGLAVYLALSYLFKVKEIYSFLGLARRIGEWRKIVYAQPEPILHPSSDQD
jgi:putative peptidoglycan lipid II flippase